jgi:hypothetical protein
LTLKCQDREFKAHRAILELESDYFKAMFTSPWAENVEGLVHLDSAEPDICQQVLCCFYNRSLAAVQEPHKNDLHFDVRLYLFGEAYLAERLQKQAFDRCSGLLESFNRAIDDLCSITRLFDIVILSYRKLNVQTQTCVSVSLNILRARFLSCVLNL